MNQTTAGRICTYDDFREASPGHRRTEQAQRKELQDSIDQLAAQGDFWSIDILRRAASGLIDSTGAGDNLYHILLKAVQAEPGQIVLGRR